MRIYKISNQKASYVGNCSDSFDTDSGECLFDFFRDVSDFAYKEEEIREQIDGGRILLSLNDFAVLVDIEPISNKDLKSFEFYLYPQTELSPQVYVAYNIADDIHYFFR